MAQGPPPLGGEFQVNTYTTSSQWRAAVAADASGNFVVVWTSYGPEGYGSAAGISGQRYDAAGRPVGDEFQVNTYSTYSQFDPAIATDASGNFVVVWSSYVQDGSYAGVFGQRFDASGHWVGEEFQVNTSTIQYQWEPAVAASASGDFVVVWEDFYPFGSSGIFGQRFDPSGQPVGPEFRVNTYTTSYHVYPAVAADPKGNFVVVWVSYDGSLSGVFAQRYDGAGNRLGEEFQVNTHTTNYQQDPAVAADARGNFVVAWTSFGQVGPADDIVGQRYDAAGNPVGVEFQVNSYTISFQHGPAVAADLSGSFVVVWHSSGQDGDGSGVFGQRYDDVNRPGIPGGPIR